MLLVPLPLDVQRVIPQQDLSEQSTSEAESTSQPETVVVEPQQSTSGQQTTVVTPLTQQVSTTVATTLVQPTIQPSTSREGVSKRTREDSVEDETEAKRSKMTVHQEAQVLPTIVVTESAEINQSSLTF